MGRVLVILWSIRDIRNKSLIGFHSENRFNSSVTTSISMTYRTKCMAMIGKSQIFLTKKGCPLSGIFDNVDRITEREVRVDVEVDKIRHR